MDRVDDEVRQADACAPPIVVPSLVPVAAVVWAAGAQWAGAVARVDASPVTIKL
ncbi:hypothetical protein NG2371_07114 [Nocardia gamkensis]|nr:hypothetical protein [Nocardia gamkensis]